MGEHIASSAFDEQERKAFVQHLIDDIRALERMIQNGMIEDDIVRIGAEQEMCLVNSDYRPAPISMDVLKALDDSHFTTEFATYNVEANLDPLTLESGCFAGMEEQLRGLLTKVQHTSKAFDAKIILTGILPSISKDELGMDFMTPIPRYYRINDVLRKWRGDDFSVRIKGVDELSLHHDSVLFEACNTSFQLHLQIHPDDFIKSYNWAQAISGPVLSICTNSPLLLGRELWSETRIALFQQSLDTRKWTKAVKEQVARVGFGERWQKHSVAEIFKQDISTHRILLTKPIEQNALELLDRGEVPKLEALSLFNSTVYRWNRPCYGVGNGKPHLRIENRYIPSGPTVIDEMANFAFWVGLMAGRPKRFDDMPSQMDFKEAKLNFLRAATNGRNAMFTWKDKAITAKKMVLEELLPIAYDGLRKYGVDEQDIERLLGIIAQRTKKGTGAEWQIKNFRSLRKQMKLDSAIVQLTKAMSKNQETEKPVHEWESVGNMAETTDKFKWVGQIMSTKLMKLYEDDYANLAMAIMKWNNIHHLPVENGQGELVGLLTWTHIERLGTMSQNGARVSDIMIKDVFTVEPKTEIKAAKKIMQDHQIGCLPVLVDTHVVGIVSKVDL
ncbi:CBS domain-containing protein [Flagellimonas zhangzhouensis]|uniref:CBS domain-containing protein n=1 Tax=Flagellimonas zhangzhouensis TaxID=1073328 RepID=A0A1H2WT57_9FLAO|nr:CBS domain-containing protein [Allomuricauda zhangzhouensis]SDQ24461.1 CBS domain-containing protein [Allomuricauda zhangzhouensis]SDW83698.1 CBS domain-containing protein [Allomuricauda zhangzhouensis]